jgi:cell division septum initiation protein DivIVA
MAISFSRPDPSSPAAVGSAQFSVVRRGFEQEEVRDLLRGVSAELARLQERERFLESELRAMQTRGLSAPGALDEEMVTALLGEETARVLTSAREAAKQQVQQKQLSVWCAKQVPMPHEFAKKLKLNLRASEMMQWQMLRLKLNLPNSKVAKWLLKLANIARKY